MRVDSEFTVKRFNKQGEKIFLTPDSSNPVKVDGGLAIKN